MTIEYMDMTGIVAGRVWQGSRPGSELPNSSYNHDLGVVTIIVNTICRPITSDIRGDRLDRRTIGTNNVSLCSVTILYVTSFF